MSGITYDRTSVSTGRVTILQLASVYRNALSFPDPPLIYKTKF